MRRSIVVLVLLLAGCSGGGGGADKEAACRAVENYAAAVSGVDENDHDSVRSGMKDAKRARAVFIENAPDRVGDALRTMDDIDPDSIRISEQKAYKKAQATANDWVREECDLDLKILSSDTDRERQIETPESSTVTSRLDYGPTPCPALVAARKTTFPAPFKKCIDDGAEYVAVMKTDVGDIEITLDSKLAPLTVNNMVALARYHYYDGVPFHRVITDFVVQGGDGANGDGTGGPGFTIKDELPKASQYEAGSLAMANSGPDTNGSQFFIVTSAAGAKTLVSAVGGKALYTLFGQVTSGMDVVKKIEADGSQSGMPTVVHRIITLAIKGE